MLAETGKETFTSLEVSIWDGMKELATHQMTEVDVRRIVERSLGGPLSDQDIKELKRIF